MNTELRRKINNHIYINGSMVLILLKNEGNNAHFLRIDNNELIIAYTPQFTHTDTGEINVTWQSGSYCGNINNHIKYKSEVG